MICCANSQRLGTRLASPRSCNAISASFTRCAGVGWRDAHGAEDAAQAVFIALARKAGSVAAAPSVAGWLHRSACYETNNLMRGQFNRRSRETEAHRLGTISADSGQAFEGLERVLDDVLCELPESDREAILARFFAGKSYAELGALLRASENAARMRVDRALGKLRDRLQRRGVTSTAAALAGALPGYSAVPAPPGFAPMVTKASLAGLATMAVSAGLIGFMSIGKIATTVAVLAVLGGLAYQFHHASALEAELATARAESAAAMKQAAAIEHEIAEIKRPRSSVTVATTSAPAAVTTAAPPPAPPPPVPGVTPGARKAGPRMAVPPSSMKWASTRTRHGAECRARTPSRSEKPTASLAA